MACASRHMARSFLSSARAVVRSCGNKTASAGAEIGASAKGGAAAPRSAAAPSSTSPKSFFMESRRPGAFFTRLPGEVACIQSLLPLHNATASARMVSQLRISAGALLQGGMWIIDDA
nr:protein NUCLEAR FUSION DEFECTIVE 6, chloroplastic/mitochondrial-like isoform X1 [Physcomitrium patens]|eukprot:XP_024363365.1 protein NUCLEAR FUSION DEFECTIVE 6, chloroplastic/mitochondrial-like isoform X1 [Physcomitrella patens]